MGRIEGGYGSGDTFAGIGIDVEARAIITNDGWITGGSGYISGVGSGIGVKVAAQHTIVDNAGTISGGLGGSGYTGGVGIYFNASGTLSNTGT